MLCPTAEGWSVALAAAARCGFDARGAQLPQLPRGSSFCRGRREARLVVPGGGPATPALEHEEARERWKQQEKYLHCFFPGVAGAKKNKQV